jgi:hypothetical protein
MNETIGLLVLALSLPEVIHPRLAAVLLVAILGLFLIKKRFTFPVTPLKVILPLLLLIAVGSLGFLRYPAFDVTKDIFYISVNVSGLFVGYLAMRGGKGFSELMRAILIAGTGMGVLHLINVVRYLRYIRNVEIFRFFAGHGFLICAIAVVTLIVIRREKISVFRDPVPWEILTWLLCGGSLVFSFSRLEWVVVVLLLMALWGWFTHLSWKEVPKILGFVLLLGGLLLIARQKKGAGDHKSFLAKMAWSLDEMVVDLSKGKNAEGGASQGSFRAYEAFRAIRQYLRGTSGEYIVGQGFGSLVDIGYYQLMGDGKMYRFLPVIHNGWAYLLFKSGILGVLCNLVFLAVLLRIGYRGAHGEDPHVILAGKLLVGLTLSMGALTLVVSGIFSPTDLVPVFTLTGATLEIVDRGDRGDEASTEMPALEG